ncbi:hypothetical protein, partial [Pseudomonas marginalis]|uniref:hypothetical protein n=1 Tax=Pseudomonas marginalis TaxID=298 RepID=UPI0020130DC5
MNWHNSLPEAGANYRPTLCRRWRKKMSQRIFTILQALDGDYPYLTEVAAVNCECRILLLIVSS